jgi:cytochrome c peroxidase
VAAFLATLLTPGARFDAFLTGDETALTATEQRGLALFIQKGCAGCHAGANLGGKTFYPFGVVEPPPAALRPPGDKGRSAVTGDPDDDYFFRTAPLRNVALTAPYFHSGKVRDLREAVRVMAATQLGPRRPVAADEVEAIAAFLESLSGRQPSVGAPVLPPADAR